MKATLVVPAPFAMLSGGYAYDRRMVAGLRASGHHMEVIELAGTHPLPDDAARAAAEAALARAPGAVIDGLALPSFAGLDVGRAVGLIHHPTALETGLDTDARDRLRAAELALLPALSRIVATSTPTAERLATEFGVDRARIAVVVPGTDPAPRAAGSGGPRCAILAVGALVPRKGHDQLLRALARLFDLDWTLTIVGSAERNPVHARTLTALAEELRIANRVTFAGEVDQARLDALWHGADVFALATHFEGYGMAVAEALRRGLPVAVMAGGAAGALVTPENGVACEPGDLATYSKALRRLIFDRDLRAQMAQAAWTSGQALPHWDSQVRAFATVLAG